MASESKEQLSPPKNFSNPFLDLIRIEQVSLTRGQAVLSFEPRPELTNMHGAVHGGVIMTLLDTTMARAAMSQHRFELSVVSIGVTVNFVSPGYGRLTTRARVVGGGRSTCFCEAEITDERGCAVAKGMGTFKFRRPPIAEGKNTPMPAESIE